jgi:hypothetical protein
MGVDMLVLMLEIDSESWIAAESEQLIDADTSYGDELIWG